MKTRLALSGMFAALLLGSVVNAHAGPGAKIDVRDLDLRKPQDVATLYTRIEQRAATVCNDASSPWDGQRLAYVKKCVAAAVEAAVASANSSALTALHQAKTHAGQEVAQNRK